MILLYGANSSVVNVLFGLFICYCYVTHLNIISQVKIAALAAIAAFLDKSKSALLVATERLVLSLGNSTVFELASLCYSNKLHGLLHVLG